jgi:hypothetical protein
VRRPPGLGAYITICVLGDEAELLSQLGITPHDYARCNLYWKLGRDVDFVEIIVERDALGRSVGLSPDGTGTDT